MADCLIDFPRARQVEKMVFSYIRIRCPVEEAMARYGRWLGEPELGPPRLIPEGDKIDLALDEGGQEWLGLAVFIYQSDGWAVVEEISGGLGLRPPETWLTLAEGGDLVYAACNDAVPYAKSLQSRRAAWSGTS